MNIVALILMTVRTHFQLQQQYFFLNALYEHVRELFCLVTSRLGKLTIQTESFALEDLEVNFKLKHKEHKKAVVKKTA